MQIAVVDDEEDFLREIAGLIQTFSERYRCQMDVTLFRDAETFLEVFQRTPFPVVFMDIYLKQLNGITAASRLRLLDKNCLLIFFTSSADFMPDAFSCHAFEYIVKPATPERVFAVLSDILEVLPSASEYIQVVSERKLVTLLLSEIVSAVTDAHYLNIGRTDGSVIRSRMTIQEFLHLVDQNPCFITVNKGIVLNADWITEFENNCCIMSNGTQFPIRVRDRVRVEQMVREYHFAKIRSRQKYQK